MFMHTNVSTVRESNPQPLRNRRVFSPLRQIGRLIKYHNRLVILCVFTYTHTYLVGKYWV
jgi:hypothetical protein